MKKKGNYILPILLLLYLFWPIRDFGISSIAYEATVSIILLVYIIKNRIKFVINNNNKYYLFITLVILIQFLLPNASENYRKMLPIVLNLILSSLCLVCSVVNERIYIKFIKISLIFGILYSMYLIVFTINSTFYINNILPLLRGVDKTMTIELLNRGYGVPIAGSTVYTSYLIMLCISIVFNNLSNKDNNILNSREYIICLTTLIIAQFLVGRRSETISLLITIVFVYIFQNENNIIKKLNKIFKIVFFVLIGTLIIYLLINNGHLSRFAKMFNQIENGINDYDDLNALSTNRISLWRMALETFKNYPIFGVGLGKFVSDINIEMSVNVHNTYLQFLCESGIVGFVLLTVPIFVLYIRTYKMFRLCSKYDNLNSKIKTSIGISFCVQTYFCILNFIDPAFYKSFYQFMYAISIILFQYSKTEYANYEKKGFLG